ncbi:MAG: hypothetical protein JWL91_1184 [Sphingomonas bacterium]|nr:hypothetical protein [Sphingomonas bacterium]MDB5689308.1 hypothetical protein [Sphingomonas bacterium]
MNICLKRREAPIAYTIDWGRGWIGAAGIRASHWTVEAAGGGGQPESHGIAVTGAAADEGVTRATISGGVPGVRYTVRGHVELTDGRTGTRALALQIGAGR